MWAGVNSTAPPTGPSMVGPAYKEGSWLRSLPASSMHLLCISPVRNILLLPRCRAMKRPKSKSWTFLGVLLPAVLIRTETLWDPTTQSSAWSLHSRGHIGNLEGLFPVGQAGCVSRRCRAELLVVVSAVIDGVHCSFFNDGSLDKKKNNDNNIDSYSAAREICIKQIAITLVWVLRRF